jgi:uncharacterized membrane protein
VDTVQDVSLVAATVVMGLMAGVFAIYSNAIMPGLRRTDDRTFVDSFQQVDRAIINPLFMTCFLGALALTALAGAVRIGDDPGSVLGWIIAAFVLYLLVVIVTIAVNVPMNDALKAAGEPDTIDVAAVRRRFDEKGWTRWNTFRALATTAATVLLAVALLQA